MAEKTRYSSVVEMARDLTGDDTFADRPQRDARALERGSDGHRPLDQRSDPGISPGVVPAGVIPPRQPWLVLERRCGG
jgi:hypothetical protein